MAKLVLAVGAPHPPRLVREIEDSPEPLKSEAMFKQVRQFVENAEPDIIIEVDSDHFVNFFYNNVPAFCVGLAEESEGPIQITFLGGETPRWSPRGDGFYYRNGRRWYRRPARTKIRSEKPSSS